MRILCTRDAADFRFPVILGTGIPISDFRNSDLNFRKDGGIVNVKIVIVRRIEAHTLSNHQISKKSSRKFPSWIISAKDINRIRKTWKKIHLKKLLIFPISGLFLDRNSDFRFTIFLRHRNSDFIGIPKRHRNSEFRNFAFFKSWPAASLVCTRVGRGFFKKPANDKNGKTVLPVKRQNGKKKTGKTANGKRGHPWCAPSLNFTQKPKRQLV